MREYIKNLTNNLIGNHSFDEVSKITPDRDQFLSHVFHILLVGEVSEMTPETLGKIMGSFDAWEVMTGKQEISKYATFAGDSLDFLREIVALFLAVVIRDRLNAGRGRNKATPVYLPPPVVDEGGN